MLRNYKHIFFAGLIVSMALGANAQDTLTTQADQMPYFKGCEKMVEGSVEKRNCSNQALIDFIATNLQPPKSDVTGLVYITFFIAESGQVENVTVLRGLESPQNEAALKVIKSMPEWEPARLNGKEIKVKMTIPIRFTEKSDADFANGFQITWGNLKGSKIARDEVIKSLSAPITVRDEMGNPMEINELMFERERSGKFADAHSNGFINVEMQKLVKKLKSGDNFTLTVTVQKRGQFFYCDRNFIVE